MIARTKRKFCQHEHCSAPLWGMTEGAHHWLCSRSHRYHAWHHHPHHRKVHFATLALYISLIVSLLAGSFVVSPPSTALAADTTWNFATAGDYSLSDSTQVEVSGNTSRLKVRNYATDADTKTLYHFDESSGNPADSSGNSNTLTASNVSYTTGNLNNAVSLNGSTSSLRAASSDSLSSGQPLTIEAWTKFNSAFSANSHPNKQTIADKGEYQLYRDNKTGKLTFELADSGATTWTQEGGSNVKNSWSSNNKYVYAITSIGTDIYAGVGDGEGSNAGGAEVWKFDGTTWTKIGGDEVSSSWGIAYDSVNTLAVIGSTLYAGLGSDIGDAEVWSWNGTSWTKIGGDGVNSGWNNDTYAYRVISVLHAMGSTLYAGFGNNPSIKHAEVWSWSGTSWTKIGGDGVNSSWTTNNYEDVSSLASDATYLYAGLGINAGDAEVWRWSGSSWTKIGGDAVNSSWADSTYDYVYSMAAIGTTLYAGLGDSTGEAEVWSWNGSAWTQIGGDGLNSGWVASTYERVEKLATDGTSLFAGLGYTTSSTDAELWGWNGSSWTQIGGDGVNSSWNSGEDRVLALYITGTTLYTATRVANYTPYVWKTSTSSISWSQIGGRYLNKSWGSYVPGGYVRLGTNGSKLYAGLEDTSGDALVFEFDGSNWIIIGGQEVNSSWAINTFEGVYSLASYGGNLVVGLGSGTGDAEVWSWNGSSWSKIGGDGVNSGWADSTYEYVLSLATTGSSLYAGLGYGANDAEVWSWNGSSWTKIGGDSINSGWTTNYESVYSLAAMGSTLYAGLGASSGEDEVWSWNGTSWTKIGGDGLNSSWTANYYVNSLVAGDGVIYAGLAGDSGEAEVWSWNGTSWTKIGGAGVNSSWNTAASLLSIMAVYNGDLYAGMGIWDPSGDNHVWKWNGSTWVKIGGNSINSGWAAHRRYPTGMAVYAGKLYVGDSSTTFDRNNGGTLGVYAWGNNAVLTSSSTTQDTSWHHLAATYDSATMKLYIDGTQVGSSSVSQTVPTSTHPLRIGGSLGAGSSAQGPGDEVFNGLIDEVRISGTTRSSFTTTPYSASVQTVTLASAVHTSGVKSWDGFSASETLNGGTVTYRLSADGGTTWKYWSGSAWATSSSTSQANAASVINSNISTFTVGTGGVKWQAVLAGNGSQQVTLNSVTLSYTADTTAPTNPSGLTALNQSGGSTNLTSGAWYNYTAPYFSWSGATDTGGSGVEGYWVYFGTDSSADPATAGSFQTGSTYTASNLTSGATYYLRLKARDNAQNVSASAYAAFTYKFDTSLPTAPKFISVSPSGYSATNSFTFLWPGSGVNGPSEGNSSIAGYQYKTGASSGTYASYSSTITDTSVTLTNIAYIEGVNTFYLRVIDTAGNASEPVTASFYYNASAPTAPQSLTATPSSSTTNSFAFSWNSPASYQGDASKLVYLYSINTVPTATTVTSNGNTTSLAAGTYATQQGQNTLYVVAKDAAENVNYAAYASVTFTAATIAPGQPLNLVVSDSSNRATTQYRLSLTWETPSSGGAVSSYKVYRATDGATFSLAGSTSSNGYIDTGLSSDLTYSYKVKAFDNAGASSVDSSTVSKKPTGKYTTPPSITVNPSASAGATSATITWTTGRASDSFIEYGQTTSYGSSYGARDEKTSHSVTVTGLTPGTIYHYRVQSLDAGDLRDYSEDQGKSADFSFETSAAPKLSSVKFNQITTSSAILTFETNKASSALVEYGESTNYGQEIKSESSSATKHTILLKELKDGTTYQLRVTITDAEGNSVTSPGHAFTTIAKPQISNVRFETLTNEAQTAVKVTWTTNVAATGGVEYSSDKGESKETASSQYQTNHEFVIRGLQDQSTYTFKAVSRDSFGNEAVSDGQSVTTPLDSRPPTLKNLTVEIRSSGLGSTQKAQLVVSWETDEPSTSQIEYGPGISSESYAAKSQEDATYATNHVVIVSELEPAKLYHLRAVSKDRAGNLGASADTTAITGKVQRSVIDVIINSLSRSLGFLGKLGR